VTSGGCMGARRTMGLPGRWAAMSIAAFLCTPLPAAAAEKPAPAAETLWTMRGLLDPIGGPRDQLRARGIGIDGRITHFYSGFLSGDGRKFGASGAKADAFLTLDSEKLGLWKGFSVTLHQEWNIGLDSNSTGAGVLLPPNTAMALPRLGGYDHDTSIVVSQRFTDALSVSAGKFNLLDLAAKTPVAGGGGIDTFSNIAIAAPISGVTPPYLLGAIATYKTNSAIFTLMVYDPRNAQDPEVLRQPFRDGTTASLAMTVPVVIGGLQGFYGIRGVYSTKSGFNLQELPALLLPPASRGVLQKNGYWYGSVSAQQYLWQDPANPGRAWGFFADLGLSDGNPNAFHWHVIAGFGGASPIQGRPLDRWGIAYFKYGLSDDLKRGLRTLGISLRNEQGLEAFYNLAVTPWLRVSATIQWIDTYQTDKASATYAGLRTQVKF